MIGTSRDSPCQLTVYIRPANLADVDAILVLHQEAFADKFGGAFGSNGIMRGAAALAAAWRRQGAQALRGMFIADWQGQVVGTTALRTWEMRYEDNSTADMVFKQILGIWGATRSIFALSLLEHRINRGEGFITDVAVLAPFRRRGIAHQLMAHAETEARIRRKQYLSLYVSAANIGARTLYKQLGFNDAHIRRSWLTRLIFGQRSWVYMRKDLT